jgi:hypothetical protein
LVFFLGAEFPIPRLVSNLSGRAWTTGCGAAEGNAAPSCNDMSIFTTGFNFKAAA